MDMNSQISNMHKVWKLSKILAISMYGDKWTINDTSYIYHWILTKHNYFEK